MKFSAILTVTGRRWLALILALLSAIALTSCNPTQFRTQAAQVPQIVLSVANDPKTFNYILSQEVPNIFGLTFKGLTTLNGVGKIEPELAESWQFSDDKLRVVFNLREGLKL